MKRSYQIGRFLGIDVFIHITFVLLLVFVGLATWLVDKSPVSALLGLAFFGGLFVCVLLHEYGHALMARRYGIRTTDITLLPIGGVARLERMPEKPSQEIAVALAGPAVNVVVAALLAGWLTLTGGWEPLSTLTPARGSVIERLLIANVLLVGFNLLPAFPMDGGRVLRAVLALRFEYVRATRLAATVGQGMAVVFGFAGLWGNPMLIVIAIFVWIGATQESAAAQAKAVFADVDVRAAMLTDFRTRDAQATAEHAAQHLLAGSQQDFPVLGNGALVGLLTRDRLFAGLRDTGPHTPVTELMDRDFSCAAADEPLAEALRRLSPERGTTLVVLDHGALAGLVTAENLGEFVLLRTALKSRQPPPRWLPPQLNPGGPLRAA